MTLKSKLNPVNRLASSLNDDSLYSGGGGYILWLVVVLFKSLAKATNVNNNHSSASCINCSDQGRHRLVKTRRSAAESETERDGNVVKHIVSRSRDPAHLKNGLGLAT